MKRVFILDDEKDIVDTIVIVLESMGYEAEGFYDSKVGLKSALDNDYDLYVIDLKMPEINGAEITKAIKEKKPKSKILVISQYKHDKLAIKALKNGAISLVEKPFEISKIITFLK